MCVHNFNHDKFVQNSSGRFRLRKQVFLISKLYHKAWTQNSVDFFEMHSLLHFFYYVGILKKPILLKSSVLLGNFLGQLSELLSLQLCIHSFFFVNVAMLCWYKVLYFESCFFWNRNWPKSFQEKSMKQIVKFLGKVRRIEFINCMHWEYRRNHLARGSWSLFPFSLICLLNSKLSFDACK